MVLALLGGCGPETIDIRAALTRVSPEELVFDVNTLPELPVCALGTCATSDASGHVMLRVPVTSTRRRLTRVELVATYEPMVGSPRTGSATIELGFEANRLADIGALSGSWVRAVSRGESSLRVHSYEGATEQFGSAGASEAGLVLVGPPETDVQIGTVELRIPATGVLQWSPSGAELLNLVNATITTRVSTRVHSPGQDPEEGALTLQPGRSTRVRIFDHLRGLRQGVSENAVPWFLLVRLSGDRVLQRLPGVRTPLPQDTRFDAFEYYAFEEEVSRSPADETCLHVTSSGMNADGSYYVNTTTGGVLGSSSSTITPEEVLTRVSIRNGLGDVIATETFEVSPPYPCNPTVYPSDAPINEWIRETLPRRR
ncbi:MAG: hypothetical protein AB8H86_24270 [Polyangiales bacterium]